MANRIWWMQLHKASLKPTNCIAFNIYSSILKPIFMKGYFQRALPRTMSMISLDIASQMVCIMKVLWTVAVQRSITSFWHQWRWSGTKGRKKYFQTKSLTRWNFFLGSCNTSQRRFGSIHCGVWEKKLDWGHLPKHITQMTTSQSTRYSRKALVTKKTAIGNDQQKMKNVVQQQQHEVEKAVIGVKNTTYVLNIVSWFFLKKSGSEWLNCSVYSTLKSLIPVSCVRVWKHVGQVPLHVCQMKQNRAFIITMTLPSDSFDSLSVSHEDALTVTRIPKVVAEGVWTKASMLITESNAITFAPGFGKRDRIVKSTSGPSPHLVIATKEFQYKCDDKCPKYKSLSLCLHRVTAAESNGELHSSWIGSEKHDQNKR